MAILIIALVFVSSALGLAWAYYNYSGLKAIDVGADEGKH